MLMGRNLVKNMPYDVRNQYITYLPLPVLLPYKLGKLYDTRKLESHDGTSYVAVGRFDNDVKSFF
jgi:hypothetical protein